MKWIRTFPLGWRRWPAGLYYPSSSSLVFRWLRSVLCALPWQEQGEIPRVSLVVIVMTLLSGSSQGRVALPPSSYTWSKGKVEHEEQGGTSGRRASQRKGTLQQERRQGKRAAAGLVRDWEKGLSGEHGAAGRAQPVAGNWAESKLPVSPWGASEIWWSFSVAKCEAVSGWF